MNIQIGCGAKALDERDRAVAGSAKFEARPLDHKAGNDPVDHLQERRGQLRLSGAAAQAEKSVRETAACEEGIELAFDKLRQTAATLGFDLRQEAFEVLLNSSIEDRFFMTPPLVMAWICCRRGPGGLSP